MPLFPNGTVVIANGTKLIEEMKNAPEEAFDFVGFVAPVRLENRLKHRSQAYGRYRSSYKAGTLLEVIS